MSTRSVRIAGLEVVIDLGPIESWSVGQPWEGAETGFRYSVRPASGGYDLLEGHDLVERAPDAGELFDRWQRRAVGRVLDHLGVGGCVGLRGQLVGDRLVIGPARPGPLDSHAGGLTPAGIVTPDGRFVEVWSSEGIEPSGIDFELPIGDLDQSVIPSGLLAARAVATGAVVAISAALDRRDALRCLVALAADRPCRLIGAPSVASTRAMSPEPS